VNAIVNTAAGRVEWQDWPTPQPGPGQVRVRIAACGICATDLEMIAGPPAWQRTGFPAIPGHEWSGWVDAVGPDGDAGLIGRPCVAENVLADGGEVGFEHPGGYGQLLLTEANNVLPLPAGFPLHVAALIEPLAVCVRATRRLRIERRESALILGDGPVGLLMLALLKADGIKRIVLVGGRPARLDLAGQLGADAVINYHEAGDGMVVAISAEAEKGSPKSGRPGFPFQNVVEASGSTDAARTAIELASPGGHVLVIGDYGGGRADFPWNRLLHRELELIGSNASAGAWPEAVRLATSGAVPLDQLISRRLPAASFAEAIDLARHSRDVIKVVMEWPNP